MMISNSSLAVFLGKNSSPLYIISSAIFVATLFFYIISIGSFFQVEVSTLENRVNFHKPFIIYVFSKQIDQLIIIAGTVSWLFLSLLKKLKFFIPAIFAGSAIIASLIDSTALDIVIILSFPTILSLLFYNRLAARNILRFFANLHLNYIIILFAALSVASLAISSVPLFSSHASKISHDYAYDIFLLFSSFSSILIFLLVIGSVIKLLFVRPTTPKTEDTPSSEKKSNNKILYLVLIILLSVVLSLIPHHPAINVNNQMVGSDSGDYVTMLNNIINTKDSQEFIQQTFVVQSSGDRPLTLIFLYGMAKIAPGNLSYMVDHIPTILVPALVLSVFLLTRELTADYNKSLFAAFVTAVSFQALIGIYGGLYSNLFALVVGYFSFYFLIRFLKNSGRINFIAFLSCMIAFVYSHVYTWTVLTIVMSVFLILMYRLNHYDKKRIILLSFGVVLSVIIDVTRTIITAAQGGISQDVVLASHGVGLYQLPLLWNTLTDTMQNYGGGQFGNFIILILCFYWLYKSDLHRSENIFLTIFLAIGTLPLLFGNDVIQSRVLYDIPFQIPAGIALASMGRKTSWFKIPLSVCILLFAISLRIVTNFYFVSPF